MDLGPQDFPTGPADGLEFKDWGDMVIPEGSNKGTTFSDLYANEKSRNQYRNRSASKAWLKSLVAYIKESDEKVKEGTWEVIAEENDNAAMDPPAKQPEPSQEQTICLTVPAGTRVSIVVEPADQ